MQLSGDDFVSAEKKRHRFRTGLNDVSRVPPIEGCGVLALDAQKLACTMGDGKAIPLVSNVINVIQL